MTAQAHTHEASGLINDFFGAIERPLLPVRPEFWLLLAVYVGVFRCRMEGWV